MSVRAETSAIRCDTVLAIDTATEMLSAALQHAGKLHTHHELAPRLHAQKLLPLIDQLLQQAGTSRIHLQALVFGRGPGAFTGLRTAVSVAQGIGFALDIPVLGISSLLAMAEGARRERGATQVITALDARMGEVYFAAFVYAPMADANAQQKGTAQQDGTQAAHSWQIIAAERVCKPDAVTMDAPALAGTHWLAVGTGFAVHGNAMLQALHAQQPSCQIEVESAMVSLDGQPRLPLAQDMLQLALPALRRGEAIDAASAEPVYLRDHVADKPKVV